MNDHEEFSSKRLSASDLEEIQARISQVRQIIYHSEPIEFTDLSKGLWKQIDELQNEEHGGDFEILFFPVFHKEDMPSGVLGKIIEAFMSENDVPGAGLPVKHKVICEVYFKVACRNCGHDHYVEKPLFLVEYAGSDEKANAFTVAHQMHSILNG